MKVIYVAQVNFNTCVSFISMVIIGTIVFFYCQKLNVILATASLGLNLNTDNVDE